MTEQPFKVLVLANILNISRLSKNRAATFAEACAVCLNYHKHPYGVVLSTQLTTNNTTEYKFEIQNWGIVDTIMIASWQDPKEVAEDGATGLAFLLIYELTNFTVIERSWGGTGVDYWLGYKDDILFERKARLEISGLLEASSSRVKARVKEKLKQTKLSDSLENPAYIIVVEFSKPLAQVVKK
jgi:hypothetical protein